MNVIIRPAERTDVPFLTECARLAYEQYVEAMGQKPAPMVFDFESRLGHERIDILDRDGVPVGYLVWRLTESALFLDSIAILPPQQGNGLASAAFQYLEETALDHDKHMIELYTNAKMVGNLSLYPHLGFVETDRRIENGFARVYYRKELT